MVILQHSLYLQIPIIMSFHFLEVNQFGYINLNNPIKYALVAILNYHFWDKCIVHLKWKEHIIEYYTSYFVRDAWNNIDAFGNKVAKTGRNKTELYRLSGKLENQEKFKMRIIKKVILLKWLPKLKLSSKKILLLSKPIVTKKRMLKARLKISLRKSSKNMKSSIKMKRSHKSKTKMNKKKIPTSKHTKKSFHNFKILQFFIQTQPFFITVVL